MSDPENQAPGAPDPGENATCPQCGAPLPEESTRGLCPRCLMAEAMLPTEPGEAPASRPEPPTIEEVQAAFPQLEILEIIGVGGMGVVYKARQTSLNRLVALKLLAPHREKEAGFSERFTREAQALAALNHPNIVTVHDFGQEGGFYYLLMEFVDGVNLRQAIKGNRFTPEEALAIVPPICEALQFAHDRGIVHRDIKPENLLLDKEGRIKVADFGIARILDQGEAIDSPGEETSDEDPGLTAGTALGTPNYMAPEQVDHPDQVDHRADIYSLGVVFYEMLTGEPPAGPLTPPSSRVKVDVRLDEVVLRALADSPELRWQTAADLRTQVETIAVPTAETSPPPLTDVAPPSTDIPPGESAPASQQFAAQASGSAPSTSRRKVGLIVAGVVILLLVGLAAIPFSWIMTRSAQARDKEQEALRHQEIAITEAAIQQQEAELAMLFDRLEHTTSPSEQNEAAEQINRLNEALAEAHRDLSRLQGQSGRGHDVRATAWGVMLVVPVILLVSVGVVVAIIVAVARGSKGAAVGCGIAFIVGLVLLALPLLFLTLFQVKSPEPHGMEFRESRGPKVTISPTTGDTARVSLQRAGWNEAGARRGVEFQIELAIEQLPRDWELWHEVHSTQTSEQGSRAIGRSSGNVGENGNLRFNNGPLDLDAKSRQVLTDNLAAARYRPLEIRPGRPVKLFDFVDANGKHLECELSIRPRADLSIQPSEQLFIERSEIDAAAGWVAFSWAGISSADGVDLVLETHGASVQFGNAGRLENAGFEAPAAPPSGDAFSQERIGGGRAARFDFAGFETADYQVTALGTLLVIGLGDSHRLFEFVDPVSGRKAWAEIRGVPEGFKISPSITPSESTTSEEAGFPALPPGALFVAERQVATPGEIDLEIQVESAHRDAERLPLGDPLVVKTPMDSAEGILMRWRVYPGDHPTHANRFVLDLLAANSLRTAKPGKAFHRVEQELPDWGRTFSPDAPPLPEKKELAYLTDPGSRTSFRLVRLESGSGPGGSIDDWCEIFCQLSFLDPGTSEAEPAFQLPSVEKSAQAIAR